MAPELNAKLEGLVLFFLHLINHSNGDVDVDVDTDDSKLLSLVLDLDLLNSSYGLCRSFSIKDTSGRYVLEAQSSVVSELDFSSLVQYRTSLLTGIVDK